MSGAHYYESTVWYREEAVVVVCPGCGFTYGAEHVMEATGLHECPVCGAEEVPQYDPRTSEHLEKSA